MPERLSSLDALTEEAARFARTLTPKPQGATLVTLSGDLGAGKTSFVQGVARTLGIETSVTSPTYVLEKAYALTGQAFERLVHIDAYRLKDGADLAALGFDELLSDTGTLIVLEWPERVADALPDDAIRITLSHADEGRDISYA